MLHAHLPYVRHPEHPDFLEEDWFFEAMGETYFPLAALLDRLAGEGVPFRLTLSLSPTLVAMMDDALLGERLRARVERLLAVARREAARAREEDPAFLAALAFHVAWWQDLAARLSRPGGPGLADVFRRHAEAGRLELMTCAATHAVLPLLETVPAAARAQVRVGADAYARRFGRAARGIWLPECGYAPGQEAYLRAAGLRFAFLEEHGLTDAHPRPSDGVAAPVMSPLGVVFFGRDPWSSRQVWSAEGGYPGDPDYREFHRDQGFELPPDVLEGLLVAGRRRAIGLKVHRITGDVPLGAKAPWDPARARRRARDHAGHFVRELARRATARLSDGRPPLVVSPYDAELFGHWWLEGLWFLEEALRAMAGSDGAVRAVTPMEYLAAHPGCEVTQPPLSTWGAEGYAAVWLDRANDWVYLHLDVAAERMVELARRFPEPTLLQGRALRQAARELMLAQASDWAFIMRARTSAEYAARRTRDHLLRFQALYRGLTTGRVDEEALLADERRTPIFPALDHRVYT
ncbi:MAG TPA: 1,4-alpha-glucan branching protein domain-containing protein [Vicinamibacteria bacterium]